MGILNQYACRICWKEKKLVEFHPSPEYLNRFMHNRMKLTCPECKTCLPLAQTVWNKAHERYIPVRHFWVPLSIPINRQAVDKCVEVGIFTLVKEGRTPDDDIFFSPHDGKPITLPDLFKQEEE